MDESISKEALALSRTLPGVSSDGSWVACPTSDVACLLDSFAAKIWDLAHSPAKCGHARANYKDPKWGTAEYHGEEKCEACSFAAQARVEEAKWWYKQVLMEPLDESTEGIAIDRIAMLGGWDERFPWQGSRERIAALEQAAGKEK